MRSPRQLRQNLFLHFAEPRLWLKLLQLTVEVRSFEVRPCRSQCVNVNVFWAVTTWGQYVHIGYLSQPHSHRASRLGAGNVYSFYHTLGS